MRSCLNATSNIFLIFQFVEEEFTMRQTDGSSFRGSTISLGIWCKEAICLECLIIQAKPN